MKKKTGRPKKSKKSYVNFVFRLDKKTNNKIEVISKLLKQSKNTFIVIVLQEWIQLSQISLIQRLQKK